MPLIRISDLEGGGMFGLWEITETTEMMLKEIVLSEKEKEIYSTLRSYHRREQWLSYRMLLMHILGTGITPDIYYDKFGKPHLGYYDYHISVSHSQNYSAVIVHPLYRSGIDIEMIRDNISRIAPRFMSVKELAEIGEENRVEKLHICWGAKESLYKAFGRKELDFKENILLYTSFKNKKDSFLADIITKDFKMSFNVFFEVFGEYMLVYSIEDKQMDDRRSSVIIHEE